MKRTLVMLVLTLVILLWSQNPPLRYARCVSAVGTDAYACNPAVAVTYVDGAQYSFRADVANTGAATLALSGLAAKSLVKMVGGTSQPLADNDIRAGMEVVVKYHSGNDNFQVISVLGNAAAATTITNSKFDPYDFITMTDGNATTALTVNQSLGVRFVVTIPWTFNKINFVVVTADTGQYLRWGIFDASCTLVASTAATNGFTAGKKSLALSSAYTAQPGAYYLVFTQSGGSATTHRLAFSGPYTFAYYLYDSSNWEATGAVTLTNPAWYKAADGSGTGSSIAFASSTGPCTSTAPFNTGSPAPDVYKHWKVIID